MALPVTFVAGEVLEAAQLNSNFTYVEGIGGLQLVKSQVIGTTVASVEVTGAFSATYDTYLITVSGGVGSTEALVGLKLGATTTGYYMGGNVNDYVGGATSGVGSSNAANFARAGVTTTNATNINVTLRNPFLSNPTLIDSFYVIANTAGNAGTFGGWLNNTTSYTAFTLIPATGTLTGGTIRVYGYANS
jgi:hypothetical protein